MHEELLTLHCGCFGGRIYPLSVGSAQIPIPTQRGLYSVALISPLDCSKGISIVAGRPGGVCDVSRKLAPQSMGISSQRLG